MIALILPKTTTPFWVYHTMLAWDKSSKLTESWLWNIIHKKTLKIKRLYRNSLKWTKPITHFQRKKGEIIIMRSHSKISLHPLLMMCSKSSFLIGRSEHLKKKTCSDHWFNQDGSKSLTSWWTANITLGQNMKTFKLSEFMKFIPTRMGFRPERLSSKTRKSLTEKFDQKFQKSTFYQLERNKFQWLSGTETKLRRKFIIWKMARKFQKSWKMEIKRPETNLLRITSMICVCLSFKFFIWISYQR